MPACPECASEVADNDIYCPYCGISLRPAELAPLPEDPLAQTIVTSVSQLPIPPAAEPQPVVPEPVATVETPRSDPAIEPVVQAALPEEPTPEAHLDEVAEETPAEERSTETGASEPSVAPDSVPAEFESTLHDAPLPVVEVSAPVEATSRETEPEAAYSGSISSVGDEHPSVPEASVDEPSPEPPVELVSKYPAPPELAVPTAEAEDPGVEKVVEAPPSAAIENEEAPKAADTAEEQVDQHTVPPPADAGTSAISGGSDKGSKPRLQILAGGTVLNNRYEIIKKIGGGGMGAVYLSNDRNLGGVQRAVKEMVQAHIEDA